MAATGFYADDAKRRTAAAVQEIESGTGAEIVVALRPRAADYHASCYLFGVVCAFAVLCALVWLPFEFDYETWPLEVFIAFLVGAGLAFGLPVLRTLGTSRRRMRAEVRRAARATFFDLGVGRTREHTGVLVFVSLLEREVEVVPDHGIDRGLLGAGWNAALAELAAAVRAGRDFDRFVTALVALREPLAVAAPRRDDDVNELPDELDVA